jgi:hypothetical protein
MQHSPALSAVTIDKDVESKPNDAGFVTLDCQESDMHLPHLGFGLINHASLCNTIHQSCHACNRSYSNVDLWQELQ